MLLDAHCGQGLLHGAAPLAHLLGPRLCVEVAGENGGGVLLARRQLVSSCAELLHRVRVLLGRLPFRRHVAFHDKKRLWARPR